MGYSRPGSSVHETLQARILEWAAISFSRGSSWPRNQWVSIADKFSTHLYSWLQTQTDSIEHVHFESTFLTVWNHLNSPGAEFLHFSISVLNIHWKDWCWRWNSSTLATWREELTHWKRSWCWERLKEGGEGDEGGWDGWMASPLDGHEFEQALGAGDGQGSLLCCKPWGRKESDTTEQLNWTEQVENQITYLIIPHVILFLLKPQINGKEVAVISYTMKQKTGWRNRSWRNYW